ncbi:major facilitator superfamily domain-containing protein [Xylaria intraflava]|nr:major facilitator superfamily domain-containing protein [Xylaria intraflava]
MSLTQDTATRKMTPRELFWSNLRFLLIAGGGLFGDGYLNSTIGLVAPMIGFIYFKDNNGNLPAVQGSEIKGTFSIGMILGQLLFGSLGDALGRHRVYGKECIFTIFGTLMVVLLPWHGLTHQGVVAWLSVFRFVTGIGPGGDYPMTSTLSAEHQIFGSRARLVLLAFSFISIGQLAASIVLIVLLRAFKDDIEHDVNRFEWVWRLLFGLGIIPLTATVYARFTIKETKPYEKYVANETSVMDTTKRSYRDQMRDFREYFGEWRHAKVLFATAFSWLLFDIASYGVSLNQSIVLTSIGFGGGKTPYDSMWKIAVGNIIATMAGSLPGVYLGVFLPDIVGRRNLQLVATLISSILYAIWAGVQETASSGGLITLFVLSQLALSAGPNVTTFLLPVELFPTRVRGTGHGISAASGKIGATITAFAFGTAVDRIGIRGVIGLFSGLMALVSLTTLLIPEPKGRTLEDIENDIMYGGSARSVVHSVEDGVEVSPQQSLESTAKMVDKS